MPLHQAINVPSEQRRPRSPPLAGALADPNSHHRSKGSPLTLIAASRSPSADAGMATAAAEPKFGDRASHLYWLEEVRRSASNTLRTSSCDATPSNFAATCPVASSTKIHGSVIS